MVQIADTGFLVAFWNRADTHHRWARELVLETPLRSCEAVLTEAAYLLGRPEPLLRMIVNGDLTVNFHADLRAPEILQWLGKYADYNPGFADACVVQMSTFLPKAEVLTTDRRDFTIYRTLAGQVIPCRFPEP